ncbi:MAG TPA: hypothetical protein VFU35_09335 [Jatrophihabitans sp.]|nr:hypothetical protein [Jatrophihabitans sp.]
MRPGVVGVRFSARATVSAPTSGVRLGTGPEGPVLLRLFRVFGTRVVVTSPVSPVQLIVVRTAAAGTPVQVITARAQLWAPLLRHDSATHLVTPTEARQLPGGPSLIVDDRPAEARGTAEVAPWQCRIDVRSGWHPAELRALARTDLAVFGVTGEDLTPQIAVAFGLPVAAAHGLSRLDTGSFGILRRGRVEYVTLDPTDAEAQVLDEAGGYRPMTSVTSRSGSA